ncbi:chorion peroxidase-like [Phlebotomus papatasi]|uniref:chorion peroxidase-like n=1 Tax=Phlebotomus papatasi TaxID=29031 RepID=UPI0024845514|nr:chorion peroxidase-like [Phlebotomus papatasi]
MNYLLIVLVTWGFFVSSLCIESPFSNGEEPGTNSSVFRFEDQRYVLEVYQNATRKQELQEMYERQLFELGIIMEPGDIAYHSLRNFRLPLPASIPEAFRTSKILLKSSAFLHLVFYRNVTKRDLSEKNFYQWLYDLSRYLPPIADTARWTVECDPEAPYRSINGTCNSLTNPLAGSTLTTFSRITLPWYYDDIHAIRKGSDLRLLAAPRNIVVYLFRNRNPYEDSVDKLDLSRMPNIASLMFGQIIAHDVAQQIHTQNLFSDDGIQCCDRRNSRVLSPYERNPACIPIEISPRDPDYQAHSIGCVNLLRSETISPFGRTLSAAQQVNHATAYFDLSNVYGGTELDSNNLRTFEGGRLIMNEDNILPEVPDCTSNACYLTGDTRVNETPFLTIFSSLFFRHHNRLCLILSTLNSHWDDERLFQEARRICIAQYQHVILNEFVPSFFGPKATDEVTFDFGEPDPRARATTANEFASCAYRIFHAFVPDNFIMVDRMGNEETITMSDSIRNTTILRTRYEPILQGMMRQRVNLEGFGQEILTKVFKSPERGDMGLDLLAADIQRGRDHGLNSYVKYLEYCGYKNIKTFDDLRVVLDYKIIAKLKKVYKCVYDIDLMVGGALESTEGALIGPTFKRIILEQFRQFRAGDRFFYDRTDGVNPFTEEQLAEIKKFTAAHLFCANSNVESVPERSFITPQSDRDFVRCDTGLARIEYGAWREDR